MNYMCSRRLNYGAVQFTNSEFSKAVTSLQRDILETGTENDNSLVAYCHIVNRLNNEISQKLLCGRMLIRSTKLAAEYRDTCAKDKILIRNACNELLVKLKRKRVSVLKTKLLLLSRII